jgi:hypothetical protein
MGSNSDGTYDIEFEDGEVQYHANPLVCLFFIFFKTEINITILKTTWLCVC